MMFMSVRNPAVQGQFYPSSKKELIAFIDSAMKNAKVSNDVTSAASFVAPHAGYVYSGKTAAYTYKALSLNKNLENIETLIFVGPNHTGYGTPISVSIEDWSNVLGVVSNDKELSKEIASADGLSIDETAHRYEHSIEVQLPFMQRTIPGKKACFICMGDQSIESAELLSNSIESAVRKLKRNVIVIASSDFNHYESASIASKKDKPLFEQLEKMDYRKFYELKEKSNETSCGFGPITVSLLFSRNKGAKKGVLLSNSNSGDETGDYTSVVNYASFAFI